MKDKEFKSLESDILMLKKNNTEKNVTTVNRVLLNCTKMDVTLIKIQVPAKSVLQNKKSMNYKKVFLSLKKEFASKFDNFDTKISTYADIVQSNKPTDFSQT